ncbi:hypothetical protein GPJ56_007871 [Histomonas meleagridis]|uniref:uncharacterized protein n=1 Tax=Histomonas meleagridis TaxID=135588 RepID=UPI0035595A6D|nr:hypothetical protein GPJ56_007871 [Histomonas meleagridis]KAH0804091.1 hypothetical protein GO595_002921 [Histomonas meleagridis]
MESNKKVNTREQEELASDLIALQQILENSEINALYHEQCINPVTLHFVPETSWNSQETSLSELRESYFARKNNLNRRFEHKLWNALKITSAFPGMIKIIGVTWVTDNIMKVYKFPFAKLLGINAVDGGLFHKQGNFVRHGFVPLTDSEARLSVPADQLADVDYHDVLLITHSKNNFTKTSTESSISQCKWENPVGKPRVASLKLDEPEDQN